LPDRYGLVGWCTVIVPSLMTVPVVPAVLLGHDLLGAYIILVMFTAPSLIFGVAYTIMSRLRRSRRSVLTVSTGAAAAYVCYWYLQSVAAWVEHNGSF